MVGDFDGDFDDHFDDDFVARDATCRLETNAEPVTGGDAADPRLSVRIDVLRLAYLVEPPAREPIETVNAFAGDLVDYALAEQARVQAS